MRGTTSIRPRTSVRPAPSKWSRSEPTGSVRLSLTDPTSFAQLVRPPGRTSPETAWRFPPFQSGATMKSTIDHRPAAVTRRGPLLAAGLTAVLLALAGCGSSATASGGDRGDASAGESLDPLTITVFDGS